MVDLFLVVAGDLEGDRLVERELRAAVEGDELLAVGREVDGEHVAGGLVRTLGVVGDGADGGVLEEGHVEAGGLLRPAVEPETRGESVGVHEYLLGVEHGHHCRPERAGELIGRGAAGPDGGSDLPVANLPRAEKPPHGAVAGQEWRDRGVPAAYGSLDDSTRSADVSTHHRPRPGRPAPGGGG
ncbi:hypothetical protein SAM23877_0932 [Streptomyces ambofaciens ATCC 23877]|uniref:Uncharacterized protein n=1 Tax=Streptomyces ambofaciens (strain ATCC 23877 / 3486 / DSM 40053 / JCM 4204 / NBRC 12836 / NRRL B-2516) TaxID=278992 RepID=A0A0K2AM32_STRA7|nr:hypothetical protein SAM23877_0932 [Streptomyces ambofaciens ATCC 23877]